jgi:hypothetical protein
VREGLSRQLVGDLLDVDSEPSTMALTRGDFKVSRRAREKLVAMARRRGLTDAEILHEVLQNVYGGTQRRELVVEWGEALGLETSDALRLAFSAGLIPSVHPPRDDDAG